MDLKEKYEKEVRPEIMKRHNYTAPLQVARLAKIVVHTGVGRVKEDKDKQAIAGQLALIAGQRPYPRPAKKSIASFKTRQGMILGYAATLRGKRMYDFLSKLIEIALPRTRDFWGINATAPDGAGNLTIGVKEHIVFPEIVGEDVKTIFGLEVTIVTTAKKREDAIEMYTLLGIPFKK